MFPRQIADRFAQRVARAAVVGVLTLGLGLAVAPSAARAEGGLSDLTASPAYPGVFSQGQRAMVGVVIQNNGNTTARITELKVLISKGFADVTVHGAFGQQWDCGPLATDARTGATTVTCQTPGLEAVSHKSLLVYATARDESDLWMVAVADPENKIWETNDDNNVGKLNLGPNPVVRAPQFYDPGYRPNVGS